MSAPAEQGPGFEILYEDNHLLGVVKPAGLLSQGDQTGDPCLVDLVRDYLRRRYDKPGQVFVGLIHRLDRPVSGVMVLARTSKAAQRLSEQVRTRRVRKVYHAVVEGRPDPSSGELRQHLLKRAERRRVLLLDDAVEGSREAALRYRTLESAPGFTLLEVELLTGRSHQIRAQLAGLGHPIVGDLRYGSSIAPGAQGALALRAQRLELEHPIRAERLCWEAPPPDAWPWPPSAELSARTPGRGGRRRSQRAALAEAREDALPLPAAGPPRLPSAGASPVEIVWQDPDLAIAIKPAGMPVQETLDPGRSSLAGELASILRPGAPGERLLAATRLPAAASGLVVFTRSRRGARCLEVQLKERTLGRIFALLVQAAGAPGLRAGEWQMGPAGCRIWVGPAVRAARCLLVEPVGVASRQVEEVLRALRLRPWQDGAGDEARHLLRLRLSLSDAAEPSEFGARLVPRFDPWLPGLAAAPPPPGWRGPLLP